MRRFRIKMEYRMFHNDAGTPLGTCIARISKSGKVSLPINAETYENALKEEIKPLELNLTVRKQLMSFSQDKQWPVRWNESFGITSTFEEL